MPSVLGIYGSPRKGGNTDLLLDQVLEGGRGAGAEVNSIYARDLKITGCLECGGCDETGKCVVQDDMDNVYPLLEEANVIFLASPNFFYNVTAQVKINSPNIQQLIIADKVGDIETAMARSKSYYGMQTFNQSLARLVAARLVSEKDALQASTSPADLQLLLWIPIDAREQLGVHLRHALRRVLKTLA